MLKVPSNSGTGNLEGKVEMLSQDMRALMLSGRGGTIVLSTSQGSIVTKVMQIFAILIRRPSCPLIFFMNLAAGHFDTSSRNWHVSLV